MFITCMLSQRSARKVAPSRNYRRTGIIILHISFSVFSTYIRQSSSTGRWTCLSSFSDIFFPHKYMICFNITYATAKYMIKCLCTRKYFTPLKIYASNLFRHVLISFKKQICVPVFLSTAEVSQSIRQ